MNFNDNSNIEVKERTLLTLRTRGGWAIRLFAIFVCLVPTSTAFGYSYYSDEWVDDSDPNNIRIVGSGVTYDPDNGYMGTPHGYAQIHSYWVKITITSPSNRTVTLNSNQGSSYVSIEASLPLLVGEEYESGDYFMQTQHWMCCPYMQPNPWDGQRCYPSSSTSKTTSVGASHAQYVRDANFGNGTGRFVPISGCNVTCMPSSFNASLICPNNANEYRLRLQAWYDTGVGRVCVPGAVTFTTPAGCVQQLAQCYESQ